MNLPRHPAGRNRNPGFAAAIDSTAITIHEGDVYDAVGRYIGPLIGYEDGHPTYAPYDEDDRDLGACDPIDDEEDDDDWLDRLMEAMEDSPPTLEDSLCWDEMTRDVA